MSSSEYIIISSGNCNFAIDTTDNIEIANYQNIKIEDFSIKHEFFDGIVFHRSNFFSVLNLNKRFNLNQKNKEQGIVFLLKKRIAIHCENIVKLEKIYLDNIAYPHNSKVQQKDQGIIGYTNIKKIGLVHILDLPLIPFEIQPIKSDIELF